MPFDVALRLILVMALWASCFPLISLGLDLAPHLAFAALRAALAGFCLVAFGIGCRRPLPTGWRTWVLIMVVGLAMTSMGFLGMFHAAEFVSPGLATVIGNVQPIIAAVLAHIFLAERHKLTGKVGLAVGVVGIAFLAWPIISMDVGSGGYLGLAYVVFAAVGTSIGNIAIKLLVGRADAVMAMGFQFLIGAAPLALLSALTEDMSVLSWSIEFGLVLAVLAVFGSALGFWLWFAALERVDLNRANAFTFLVPIFGLMLGAAFFGERLVAIQAVGVILVLTGIALVQRDSGSAARAPV